MFVGIRESIKGKLKKEKLSMYRLAVDNDIDKGNMINFLNGKCGISVNKLDKIFKYLNLKITDNN